MLISAMLLTLAASGWSAETSTADRPDAKLTRVEPGQLRARRWKCKDAKSAIERRTFCAPGSYPLTQQDAGRTIIAPAGTEFTILLPGQLGNVHQWRVVSASGLEQLSPIENVEARRYIVTSGLGGYVSVLNLKKTDNSRADLVLENVRAGGASASRLQYHIDPS